MSGAALVSAALVRVGSALALLLALLLQALQTAPVAEAQTASQAQTWDVQVGGGDEASGISLNAFFPDPVAIHVGDTVRFTIVAPHTVTFNSNRPPLRADRPLGEFVPGPGPGEWTAGPAIFPVGPPDKATYSGTEQISSGAPLGPPPSGGPPTYSVTFTAPGVFGYVCNLHPGMRGSIRVAPASDPLEETPAQARTRGQITMGELTTKMRNDLTGFRPVAAGPVHTAAAGLGDGFEVSLLGFLPGDLTVRRGDWVVWNMPDPDELHTVTFASGGTPPEFIEPRPQAAGPPLLVVPANVAGPVGGDTYTGQGYVNSGFLDPGQFYALMIDAPPGTYTYYCALHGSPEGGMRATITVTG